MEDDPGETQNISLCEVRILLRITVIFWLVASRCLDFDSELRLLRFHSAETVTGTVSRTYSSTYSSLPFLIIRARKHHREIIAAEHNVPRWHRRSTVADRYATVIRETRADAESDVLAWWCCFPGIILDVMHQQFGLRLINWASHPNCADAVARLPRVARKHRVSQHVSWMD